MIPVNRAFLRQIIIVSGAFALLWFCWDSHSRTLFNGLASPLFFALAAYMSFLATQYEIAVSKTPLFLFLLFSMWAVFADARSGEFLPALAVDTHWFVLPIAVLLFSKALREFPQQISLALRIGATLCIINILLTMYFNAEWYDNWRLPPIFGHFRHMGLSIGFMTILLCSGDESRGILPGLFRIARILGIAIVIWTGSRAAVLAWIIAFPFFIYSNRKLAVTLIVDTVIAAALAQIPAPPSPNLAGVTLIKRTLLSSPASGNLLSGRIGLWESTLAGLDGIRRLWNGLGGNGFARLQVMHEAAVKPWGHVHAHSFIVQGICDWGIIGMAFLGCFFLRSTLMPILAGWRRNDPMALSGIIYIVFTGMFDATLYHLEHLVYLAFALAWLFSRKAPPRQTFPAIQPESSGAPAPLLAIPGILTIALLAGFAAIHFFSSGYRIGLGWYFPTQ
ncbi:MAG: O-antigen ligase family protein [Candidatus Accumulibacter sp.]|jgi:hypothetical protein|nr:O-antigen ligase family protein [Accumulibacter sp.]